MRIPVKKNEEYIVNIIDNGFQGEGIAKIDGYTIFIPSAIKEEKVKIRILKVTASHAFGKIMEILEKSEFRNEDDCTSYKRCGGCNLRHIKYEQTLDIKKNNVQNLINKNLKEKIKVQNTIAMENPFFYRNKVQYPIGIDEEKKAIVGVFASRTHEIVEFDECKIQTEISQKIAKFITNFINENKITVYNENTGKGLFRHIVIKYGMKTKEIMCVLVLSNKKLIKEEELKNKLIENFPNIKTIVKNINKQQTNVILGKENIVIHGNGYIQDKLGEYIFNISANSFYQINPVQTEKLYNLAINEAKLSKTDIVFDLYCGIGTIRNIYFKVCKKSIWNRDS